MPITCYLWPVECQLELRVSYPGRTSLVDALTGLIQHMHSLFIYNKWIKLQWIVSIPVIGQWKFILVQSLLDPLCLSCVKGVHTHDRPGWVGLVVRLILPYIWLIPPPPPTPNHLSQSCPAIQVYSTKNLNSTLTQAARNFCSQEVNVDHSHRKVTLSKIFVWYGSDFGNTEWCAEVTMVTC